MGVEHQAEECLLCWRNLGNVSDGNFPHKTSQNIRKFVIPFFWGGKMLLKKKYPEDTLDPSCKEMLFGDVFLFVIRKVLEKSSGSSRGYVDQASRPSRVDSNSKPW